MAKSQINFGELGGSGAVIETQTVTNSGTQRTISTTNDFTKFDHVATIANVPSQVGWLAAAPIMDNGITSNSITYELFFYNGYATASYTQEITIIGVND